MSAPMVVIKDLCKSFGKVVAVDHVSLEVQKGELLTLLGPSGCGKTTTLRALAGLERPDEGEIYIDGKLMSSGLGGLHVLPEKRGIGMVFQSYALWPHMNVFSNVAYPLRLRRFPKKKTQEKVEAALAVVGLSGLERRGVHELSGGQQQRVALARALVFDPRVVLLDEPLSNLDAKLRGQMRFELKALQRRLGLTTVYVTHDQSEAMAISDRIAVLNQGRLEQVGTPVEMYERTRNPFVADFVGATNFIRGQVLEEIVDGKFYLVGVPEAQMELCCAHPEQVRRGDAIALSVKPQSVTVWCGEKPLGRPNTWEAQVKAVAYLGAHSEYELCVGGLILQAWAPTLPCSPGERVFVHIDPGAVMKLAHDS